MGSNKNTQPVVPMVSILVLIILVSSGVQADSSQSSSPPAMARRRGPITPAPAPQPLKSTIPDPEDDQNCPAIQVPALIDACRRAPGVRACAAECLIYHYRGGYCDLLPNGRPGDCFCKNCLADRSSKA